MTNAQSPKPSSNRPRISWPVRALVRLFGALLAFYIAAAVVMSTGWFHRLLLERTRAALAQLTGARVEIGGMLVDPWTFQVTLHELVLRGSETPPELPLFRARELVARVNPASVLRPGLRLRRLDVEGAEAHLYTRPDGSTNLPGPPASAAGAGERADPLDVAVHELVVARSGFYWNNRHRSLDFSAQNVALLLSLGGGRYSGSFSAGSLNFARPGLWLPPLSVSTRLELARNTLTLESLAWRSSAINGGGTLTLHWLPAPESQFSLQTEGEAGPLARLLGRREIQEGRVRLTATGAYRSGAIDARGHIEARRLILSSAGFHPGQMGLSADYVAAGRQVQFSNLAGSLFGGAAHGKAQVSLEKPSTSFTLALELRDLDLASALASLQRGAAIMDQFPVASLLGGKIEASGHSRWLGAILKPEAMARHPSRALRDRGWSSSSRRSGTGQDRVGESAKLTTARSLRSEFDLTLRAPGSAPAGREPIFGYGRGVVVLGPTASLDLEEAELHSPHSGLTLHGQLGQASSNLALQLQTTDFEEWRKPAETLAETSLPVKLESTVNFSGTAFGPPSQPTVQGKLQLRAFEYRGWKWNNLEAKVTAARDRLQVSSGTLLGPGSTLTLDLTAGLQNWRFTPDSPFELSARAEKTSLPGLRQALDISYPLNGLVSGEITLGNTRTHPTATGAFRIREGSYDGEPFDSLSASVRSGDGAWKLNDVALVKGRGHLTGQATYDTHDRAFSAEARGAGFSLADFRRLQNVQVPGTSVTPLSRLEGQLEFELRGHGSVDHPSLEGMLAVESMRASDVPLGDLTSRVNWNAQRGTMAGQLQGPAGTLDFRAEGNTNGDWPLQLTAQYSQLRLDPWLRSFGLNKLQAAVSAEGSFHLETRLRSRAPLSLDSRIQKLEVSFPELKWQNDRPFEITLANRRLAISPFQLQGPSTQFQFRGTVNLGAPSAVDLSAQGQIDASLLKVFEPALLTTGHFDSEVRVQGTLKEPSLHGSLHVDQVSIGYPSLPLRLTGLNGDVILEGNRLVIHSLRGASGPSSIDISGSVTLSGTPRYSLQAELSRVRVQYPLEFTSVVSGAAQLTGTPAAGLLTGDATVQQAFVSEDFNVLNWLSALQNQPPPVRPGAASTLASRIRLDVRVASSPLVTVESHDVNLVAAIDLSLRGTLADPVTFGNIHIQSGQAVLRQTRYTLSRGDITMANPIRTEPVLDLEAKTRVQRYDLILRVTGPADRPNVVYRSDPPLSTPDILALLAFGYSSQDQLITPAGRSTFGTQGASALLSQALSSQASSRITRLFGLSRIAVEPNPTSVGGARVTVEERLAPDFSLTYVTTTGGTQERIIQVEWDLTESMSLLGVRDQNGVLGLELDFRRRFK